MEYLGNVVKADYFNAFKSDFNDFWDKHIFLGKIRSTPRFDFGERL